jgi:CheY-like chemotaxis protein
MTNILVIDDTPSKVAHFKGLENDNCIVTFASSFIEARKAVKFNPQTYDKIFLDYDLGDNFTGVQLLQFLVFDKGLKSGCKIIPNSSSQDCNFKIKAELIRLNLVR